MKTAHSIETHDCEADPPGRAPSRTRSLVCLRSVSVMLVLAGCEGVLSTTNPDREDIGAVDARSVDASGLDTATDAGPVDTPQRPDAALDGAGPALVQVLVAQGQGGRSIVSCDDGRSWVRDQADPRLLGMRCGVAGLDCENHATAARGLVFGRGWFFKNEGWGAPGALLRSQTGTTWEYATLDTTFAAVAYSPTRATLLAVRTNPRRSIDNGLTFRSAQADAFAGTATRGTFLPSIDRFVVVGGPGEIALSLDGDTWSAPTSVDPACLLTNVLPGGIVAEGNLVLIVEEDLSVCRSEDRGANFTFIAGPPATTLTSTSVVTREGEFLVWTATALLRSRDGRTWTPTPTSPPIAVGAVHRTTAGTFVAGTTTGTYEGPSFYRSADGIRWEMLSATAGPPGHPLVTITEGAIDPAIACVL